MIEAVLDFLISNNGVVHNKVKAVLDFLLSNNAIVNNVIKVYVTFNTNLLHDVFYLLIKALTCFGFNCWPSSGRFHWHAQSKHIGALISKRKWCTTSYC
jgi:hypothetical protein